MTHDTPPVVQAEAELTARLTHDLRAIAKHIGDRLGKRLGKAEEDEDERARAAADEAVADADWTPVAKDSETQLTAIARSGAQQALTKLRITDDDITNQTFDAAVEWAKARAAELVGKSWDEDGNLVDNPDAEMAITDTLRDEIRSAVADGIEDGASAADLAETIDGLSGFGADRAELIARTEIIRAHGQGQLAAFRASGVVEQKAWSTAGEDVCDDCQDNEDAGAIDLDDDFPSGDDAPPGHPMCLPGGTLVTARGRITGQTQRWYHGDLVVIRTASGKELACTPNHPVLTHSGFVAAGALNEGDEVFGAREWVTVGDHNCHDVPARIEDIAKACGRSGEMTSKKVPLAAEDFHGDGIGSQVAIVRTQRFLADKADTVIGQRRGDGILDVARMDRKRLNGTRTRRSLFERGRAATGRIVRSLHLRISLLLRHLLPFQGFGLALAANVNASAFEGQTDRPSRYAELSSHGQLRRTVDVHTNGELPIEDRPGANGDPGSPQRPIDGAPFDSVLGRDIRDRLSGYVFADKIVSIRRDAFVGHVFNLETEPGWYVANGIVTHNCRCALVAVIDDDESDSDEDADEDDADAGDEAAE